MKGGYSKGSRFRAFAKKRMGDFKRGEMHSGTGRPGGRIKSPVRKRSQAVAIMLSEARSKGMRAGRKRKGRRR